MKKKFLSLFFIVYVLSTSAQTDTSRFLVDVDSVSAVSSVVNNTGLFIDSNHSYEPGTLSIQNFYRLSDYKKPKNLPRRLIKNPVYLMVSLKNNDSISRAFYFYPGMHYDQIQLYEYDARDVPVLSSGSPVDGFALLNIPKNSLKTFLIRLRFARLDINTLDAKLVMPDNINAFRSELINVRRNTKTAGFLLGGALLMMIFFTIVNLFITGKQEFLYNFFYTICMFLLIFFSTYLHRVPGWFSSFFFSYFDLILLVGGTIFYLGFTRYFLNTPVSYPALDKFFKIEMWCLAAMMALYTFIHYGTGMVDFENILENIIKIFAILSGVVYIVMSFTRKDKLMNYLAIGNGVQIIFFCISLILIITRVRTTSFVNSSLFYFELGIVVSVFFFLLGLTYKNRNELIIKIKEQEAMKAEVEKQSLERQIAIIKAQQEERSRISADMHDDLGAGMTSIRLYSEIAKEKIGSLRIEELEKISASSDELLNNMNAIIWSMSADHDTLGNMVAYIRSYAFEYLESNGIKSTFTIPERLPAIQVTGEIRRNIFLVIKEALHNVVKHSGADHVKIVLAKELEGLSLSIHDNGSGIIKETMRAYGNGLNNMKKRMDAVGISFSIREDNGTLIRLYSQTRF